MRLGCNEQLGKWRRLGIPRAVGKKTAASFNHRRSSSRKKATVPHCAVSFTWSKSPMVSRKQANVLHQLSVPVHKTPQSLLLASSGVLKRYDKESIFTKLKKLILKK
jgi:hypothetical protein